jgi:hypothetical protein
MKNPRKVRGSFNLSTEKLLAAHPDDIAAARLENFLPVPRGLDAHGEVLSPLRGWTHINEHLEQNVRPSDLHQPAPGRSRGRWKRQHS